MKRLPLRFASRKDAVQQLRARLEIGSWPRLQMMMLVALTGAAGFITSFVLLALGLHRMGLRYLLACCVAYLCFLALLWIWLRWRGSDGIDVWNEPTDRAETPHADTDWTGHGGSSGGGGASADFDTPASPAPVAADTQCVSAPTSGSDFELPDMDVEAVPLLLALLVIGLVLSSLFVVWTAPALFAELLLDGVLAAGLYRRLRHIETRHWLQTAVRKTAWPFVLTTALLAATGFGIQAAAPQAKSIGDALHMLDRAR